MTDALVFDKVSHAYNGTFAVSDVSLDVKPGEVVCLLGPSGCGKTTVLRLAAGLEAPNAGEIRIGGNTVASQSRVLPPEKRQIGFVFQDYALFPHLSVLENVVFGLDGVAREDRRTRAMSFLERVGMERYAATYPHELSGGEQQRVALARALAPEPPVVLLDEPYSGLDARLRDSVRDEVLHILKQSDAAALLVTHDAEEAMFMANRIVVMKDGAVVQSGRPEVLWCRPQSAFVAAFFGDVNRFAGQVHEGSIITPFGPVPAPHLPEGSDAMVVVRPEALRLRMSNGQEQPQATVMQSRLLGRTSLIHLDVPDMALIGDDHIHARIPGLFLPQVGAGVSVDIDLDQAFAFAASGG